VAYLLKARTVEPEKQLLLANDSEKKHSFLDNGCETNNGTSVARQQIINNATV
jgi:hypothetical protein